MIDRGKARNKILLSSTLHNKLDPDIFVVKRDLINYLTQEAPFQVRGKYLVNATRWSNDETTRVEKLSE